ncbi:MAG TPA: hypothetical protein VFG94_12375, partial [Acidimicrobiales bacterium]|nr:hypothetical protein [Acidimicrobiales bacterium]
NLVDYLDANQITPEQAQQAAADELENYMAMEFDDGDRVFESEGEALFNLGLISPGFAGGSYSCGRCHTAGWAYADVPAEAVPDPDDPDNREADITVVDREAFEAATANSGCGGALGPNLCDGLTERVFPNEDDHVAFVTNGSDLGVRYGRTGQGSGKMPGFGFRSGEGGLYWINGGAAREPGAGMLTQEQIEQIVSYERELASQGSSNR